MTSKPHSICQRCEEPVLRAPQAVYCSETCRKRDENDRRLARHAEVGRCPQCGQLKGLAEQLEAVQNAHLHNAETAERYMLKLTATEVEYYNLVEQLEAQREALAKIAHWGELSEQERRQIAGEALGIEPVLNPATKASEGGSAAASDGSEPETSGHGSAERLSRPAVPSSEASDPAKRYDGGQIIPDALKPGDLGEPSPASNPLGLSDYCNWGGVCVLPVNHDGPHEFQPPAQSPASEPLAGDAPDAASSLGMASEGGGVSNQEREP